MIREKLGLDHQMADHLILCFTDQSTSSKSSGLMSKKLVPPKYTKTAWPAPDPDRYLLLV